MSNGRSVRTAKSGFPILRLTALGSGRVDLGERKIGEWSAEDAEPYLVQKNHFFVARGNGSLRLVGLGALVEDEPDPVAYPDTMIRLGLPLEVVVPRFFALQWNSLGLRQQIEPLAKTTAGIYKVNQRDIARCEIVVPPFREQGEIASCLDTHLSKIDAAIANLKRVQANLKRYRASVLKAAVEGRLVPTEAELARQEGRDYEPASVLLTRILAERRRRWEEAELAKMKAKGKTPKNDKWKAKYKEPAKPDPTGLPELPEGWCWVTWSQIGFSQNGRSFPSKEYTSDGMNLLRPGNLHASGRVFWTAKNTRKMPREWAQKYPGHVVRGNELVMNLTAQSLADDFLGRVCLTSSEDKCLLNQRIARLTPVTVGVHFAQIVFMSPFFRRFVNTLNTGSLIQHMFTSQLDTFVLPLPPLAEQSRIVDFVDHHLANQEGIARAAQTNLRRLAPLRQSILKWAFEGKLVDQDPNDEPASVLLDRIRAEREAAKKPAKKKPVRRRKKKAST